MGQYYKPTSINKMESLNSHDYDSMLKLMEHSYIGNHFIHVAEFLLSPVGDWYKNQFVWAGDYADDESCGKNLFTLAKEIQLNDYPKDSSGRYIVNHTKREYVDKIKAPKDQEGWTVHPLPLLTCEGNGRGNGDYREVNACIGVWARDEISIEKDILFKFKEEESKEKEFEELVPNFIMD
mgnify:CR=1 FL=1|jgi:hypothetical protein|tara:strand:- start:866 stop:1405 length:540 start_codon:yes stop_codon:yes gene_type:complete